MSEVQSSLGGEDGGSREASATEGTLGRSLSEARIARGLSIADVALAIKFSPRQIEAIESDDFGKLPGATIVRGFIRSYSKLLRLDPTMLLEMFDRQVPPVVATMNVLQDTGAALPQVGERGGQSFRPLLLWGGVLALVAATGIYLYGASDLFHPASVPLGGAAPITVPVVPVPPAAAIVTPAAGVAADAVQMAAANNPVETSAQVMQAIDPDVRQLIFVFEGKSWVEVKDASLNVVLAQNNLPGTRQVVSGKPPFAVVIGNASHVQLLYEERQIDLQPYTKVDVARFSLE